MHMYYALNTHENYEDWLHYGVDEGVRPLRSYRKNRVLMTYV